MTPTKEQILSTLYQFYRTFDLEVNGDTLLSSIAEDDLDTTSFLMAIEEALDCELWFNLVISEKGFVFEPSECVQDSLTEKDKALINSGPFTTLGQLADSLATYIDSLPAHRNHRYWEGPSPQ